MARWVSVATVVGVGIGITLHLVSIRQQARRLSQVEDSLTELLKYNTELLANIVKN